MTYKAFRWRPLAPTKPTYQPATPRSTRPSSTRTPRDTGKPTLIERGQPPGKGQAQGTCHLPRDSSCPGTLPHISFLVPELTGPPQVLDQSPRPQWGSLSSSCYRSTGQDSPTPASNKLGTQRSTVIAGDQVPPWVGREKKVTRKEASELLSPAPSVTAPGQGQG